MKTDATARKLRAAKRSGWPGRKFALGAEPTNDLVKTTTPQERLAMVWPITVDTWTLSGRSIPDYPRHETPLKLIRPGD